jgi:riboflavin biosynthesis pyrimidine reductase
VVAIVSPSLNLPWEEPLFGESTHAPIVFTRSESFSAKTNSSAFRLAMQMQEQNKVQLVHLDDPAIDSLTYLREQGHQRIVCEGGPRLLESLFPFVDELDLTTAPFLVGTEPVGIQDAQARELAAKLTNWNLAQWWTEDSYTYAKYLRQK